MAIVSRILMIVALAILAYLVYITGAETFKNSYNKKIKQIEKKENFTDMKQPIVNAPAQFINPQPVVNTPAPMLSPPSVETFVQETSQKEIPQQETPQQEKPSIVYENFGDVPGMSDSVYGAAPFGSNMPVQEGDMATVNYTGLVDAQPGDVIQIEGTDLLTAPLVDNMLYTNSIANTNRNASQDLRGDLPLQFNDNYTPFYSSVIYGAPLSQKTMTISNL